MRKGGRGRLTEAQKSRLLLKEYALMPKFHPCVFVLLAVLAGPAVLVAQDVPKTATQKHLDRIDFAISAAGEITSTASGIEQRDANTLHSTLTIKPSTT